MQGVFDTPCIKGFIYHKKWQHNSSSRFEMPIFNRHKRLNCVIYEFIRYILYNSIVSQNLPLFHLVKTNSECVTHIKQKAATNDCGSLVRQVLYFKHKKGKTEQSVWITLSFNYPFWIIMFTSFASGCIAAFHKNSLT